VAWHAVACPAGGARSRPDRIGRDCGRAGTWPRTKIGDTRDTQRYRCGESSGPPGRRRDGRREWPQGARTTRRATVRPAAPMSASVRPRQGGRTGCAAAGSQRGVPFPGPSRCRTWLVVPTAEEMRKSARAAGASLQGRCPLTGDLGAGKTTLTQGIGAGLGAGPSRRRRCHRAGTPAGVAGRRRPCRRISARWLGRA
jgi:hypothetical protein